MKQLFDATSITHCAAVAPAPARGHRQSMGRPNAPRKAAPHPKVGRCGASPLPRHYGVNAEADGDAGEGGVPKVGDVETSAQHRGTGRIRAAAPTDTSVPERTSGRRGDEEPEHPVHDQLAGEREV